MIGFFPTPYPDELLYSACARYAKRVKYPNRQDIAADLFGNRGIPATIDFPSHLNTFVSRLPLNHGFFSEQIINNNTLFPFFEPFIPTERAKLIRFEMKGDGGQQLKTRTGIRNRQISKLLYLRFCPSCADEDRQNYGETYWHRLPQIAGVNVCPEHLCFFVDTSIKFGGGSSIYFYLAEDNINISSPIYINPQLKDHQILLKIAKDAKWLLSQNNLSPGTDTIRYRYYNSLLRRGLAFYNGNVKISKFVNLWESLFSSNLMNLLGRDSRFNSWITDLLQVGKVGIAFNPIRHLLLITFLEMTAEDFFNNFDEFKPFVDGPYPCLNAASEHYGKLLIDECNIFDNLTKGVKYRVPIGVFSCRCGFVYQRIGPDKSQEDKFKFSSVREHGEMWENKLSDYWQNSNISIAQIARELKTSPCKIVRHAIRLDLTNKFPTSRQIQGYKRYRNPRKTFSNLRSIYRKEWQSVREKNPTFTRKHLMNTAKFQYLWLKRNDNEWLEKNLPPIFKFPRKTKYLDWKKVDLEFMKK